MNDEINKNDKSKIIDENFWTLSKRMLKAIWAWWTEHSQALVALGTILLAAATFVHIREANKMRMETKKFADLSVREFQMKTFPSFLVKPEKVYEDSGKLIESHKIHNKGDITTHGVTFLFVNIFENEKKEVRIFYNQIGAIYKDEEWKNTLNYETKIFTEGHKEIVSKSSFPQNQSIKTLKYELLYIKFKIPYDNIPRYETFGFILKEDIGESNSDKTFYLWQQIQTKLKNDLVKKHFETLENGRFEGIEKVRHFLKDYPQKVNDS